MDIIGHARAIDFFDQCIKSGSLHHAYLIFGPAHVGKRTVADWVASRALGVTQEKLASHPDYIIIERGVDEKTGERKKDITKDQVVDVIARLHRRSFYGGYTVAIIDGIERVNASSANALLKTLEEPRGQALILMTAPDPDDLPSTLVSRCHSVYLSTVAAEDIIGGLVDRGAEADYAVRLARDARGLSGKAISWMADGESYEEYRQEVERFVALWQQPLYKKIASVESLFGDKSDHIATRDRLHEVLAIWQMETRDLAVSKAIAYARRWIGENIHPRLLVEHILLEIP